MGEGPASRMSYRFAEFVLSPSRRQLLRGDVEVPLIPRYFDLLLLLVERRGEALERREILERVWDDVVVSDGALSQAVRSLRRVLEDDPREARYIRTVSRHGYRFVYADVIEEADDRTPQAPAPSAAAPSRTDPDDNLASAFEKLLAGGTANLDDPERREAAELLLRSDPEATLRRLDGLPGHEAARALLRDARWDVAGAGPVPLLGRAGATRALVLLARLRFRRVVRIAGARWLAAITSTAIAGAAAGLAGGVVLRFGPGSVATNVVLAILPLVGAVIGALGAAGVAGGLAAAEVLVRSYRGTALVVLGSLGGGLVGAATHWLGDVLLEGLFGKGLAPTTGGLEGLVLGGAVGFAYALATASPEGGLAAPRGARRLTAAVSAGIACAVAATLLALAGRHLGASSLDFMARSFPGSQVGLDPLAHLLGEAAPGAVTRAVISAFEGLVFGSALVWGLTRRPRA